MTSKAGPRLRAMLTICLAATGILPATNAMAGTVDFGPDAKQGLLDLRSENARLRLVTRLFYAAAKRLDLVERAHERAQSNGKVRFGA